jgi:hypothetical protein
MIPKKIHQIWIQGIEKLPKKLYDNHMLIKKSNPEYEMKLWDDKSISELLRTRHPDLYQVYINCDKLKGPGGKYTCMSDIGRYVILYEYGGFYIDMDFECSINLDKLYDEKDDMIFADNTYILFKLFRKITYTALYNLAFCAFKPKHEIWDNIFKIIVNAKKKTTIGEAVDRYLQSNNIKGKIIDPNKVSVTACQINNKCFTPRNSSWFKARELLIRIGCDLDVIIPIGIIILLIYLYIKK